MTEQIQTKQLVIEIIRHGGLDGVYHLYIDNQAYSLSWVGMRAFVAQLSNMLEDPQAGHMMATYDLEQTELPPEEIIEDEATDAKI